MDETPQREHRDSIFGAAFDVCLEYGVDVTPNIYSQSDFQKRRKYPFLTDVINEGRAYGRASISVVSSEGTIKI